MCPQSLSLSFNVWQVLPHLVSCFHVASAAAASNCSPVPSVLFDPPSTPFFTSSAVWTPSLSIQLSFWQMLSFSGLLITGKSELGSNYIDSFAAWSVFSPTHVSNVWTPFFRTKSIGQGSALHFCPPCSAAFASQPLQLPASQQYVSYASLLIAKMHSYIFPTCTEACSTSQSPKSKRNKKAYLPMSPLSPCCYSCCCHCHCGFCGCGCWACGGSW